MFLLLSALSLHSQTNALPALIPAYPELPPTYWETHRIFILIGPVCLALLAALPIWLLLRPRPAAILPPELLARRALIQLQGRPEDGNVLSEVSQIVRRYIATTFQLPPGELTTAEFYVALAGNDKISIELGEAVSRFLRECDERKFSPPSTTVGVQASACPNDLPATPDTLKREHQPAATRALELISRAEVHRQRSTPGKQPAIKSSDVAASGDGRTP